MSLSEFQQQVAEDFESELLDLEVFGRLVKWNRKRLVIAEDVNFSTDTEHALASNREVMRVVCMASVLKTLPVPGEEIRLNGELWYVTQARQRLEHFIIDLSRQVS